MDPVSVKRAVSTRLLAILLECDGPFVDRYSQQGIHLNCNITGELTGCNVTTEGKVNVTETRAIGLYGNFAVLADDARRNR
jgi:hypothetical protein